MSVNEKSANVTSGNPHAGHRQRMRQRFMEDGLEHFHEHETLEMLLFYIIPRGNTNETAHALLDRFGSLYGVVTATPEQLVEVEGIGEKAAVFLNYIGAFSLRIGQSRLDIISMFDFEDRKEYFIRKLARCHEEHFLLVILNDQFRVKRCITVAKGTPGHVNVEMQKIVKSVLVSGCNQVMIAHNHPNGDTSPSFEDIAMTKKLGELLHALDIRLIDHVIVAGTRAQSLRENGKYRPPYEN